MNKERRQSGVVGGVLWVVSGRWDNWELLLLEAVWMVSRYIEGWYWGSKCIVEWKEWKGERQCINWTVFIITESVKKWRRIEREKLVDGDGTDGRAVLRQTASYRWWRKTGDKQRLSMTTERPCCLSLL